MGNYIIFAAYGVPLLHGPYYVLWKVRFEAYILTLDVNISLSNEYGMHDEFNKEAKNIILNRLSHHDVAKVRHSMTAKEIKDKIIMFLEEKGFKIQKMLKNPIAFLKRMRMM